MSFLFFFLREVHKASLTLCTLRKKKNKNDIIDEKQKVPKSEREGKPSNLGARRARDAWRKFTGIYGNPRARAARAMQ